MVALSTAGVDQKKTMYGRFGKAKRFDISLILIESISRTENLPNKHKLIPLALALSLKAFEDFSETESDPITSVEKYLKGFKNMFQKLNVEIPEETLTKINARIESRRNKNRMTKRGRPLTN